MTLTVLRSIFKRKINHRYFILSFPALLHTTSMKIVQFFRLPTPLAHLRPKFFHPLDLGRPISNELLPPLQMKTNRLKENIIQE